MINDSLTDLVNFYQGLRGLDATAAPFTKTCDVCTALCNHCDTLFLTATPAGLDPLPLVNAFNFLKALWQSAADTCPERMPTVGLSAAEYSHLSLTYRSHMVAATVVSRPASDAELFVLQSVCAQMNITASVVCDLSAAVSVLVGENRPSGMFLMSSIDDLEREGYLVVPVAVGVKYWAVYVQSDDHHCVATHSRHACCIDGSSAVAICSTYKASVSYSTVTVQEPASVEEAMGFESVRNSAMTTFVSEGVLPLEQTEFATVAAGVTDSEQFAIAVETFVPRSDDLSSAVVHAAVDASVVSSTLSMAVKELLYALARNKTVLPSVLRVQLVSLLSSVQHFRLYEMDSKLITSYSLRLRHYAALLLALSRSYWPVPSPYHTAPYKALLLSMFSSVDGSVPPSPAVLAALKEISWGRFICYMNDPPGINH